jgi:hypothetical protein
MVLRGGGTGREHRGDGDRREPKRHSVNARRSAIHGTSAKVTANDYRWSVEKMVAAHPQGGKNVERS